MLTLKDVFEDGFSFILPNNCIGELTITDNQQYQVTVLDIGHRTKELPPMSKGDYQTLVLGYTDIRSTSIDRELRDAIDRVGMLSTANFLSIDHRELSRVLSLHRRFFHPVTGREYGFRTTLIGLEFVKMVTPLRISKRVTPINTTQELLYILREFGENESSKGMKAATKLIDGYVPEMLRAFSRPLQIIHRDFNKK